MKTKVTKFMGDHAGAIIAGTYAVTMGICVVMYKKYLNHLEDTMGVFTKKEESLLGLNLLFEKSATCLLANVIHIIR